MCGGGQSTTEDSEWTGCSSSPVVTPTARQRRRHQREQEEAQRHRDRSRSSSLGEGDINKENIPAAGSVSRTISCGVSVGEEGVWRDYQTSQGGLHHEGPRPRKPKHCHQSPTLGQLSDNQDPHALKECISRVHDEAGTNNMESSDNRNDSQRKDPSLLTPSWTRLSSMKIQELPSSCETADRRGVIGRSSDQECGEDVPRLDLSALTDDNNWGGKSSIPPQPFFPSSTHSLSPPLPSRQHMGVWVAAATLLLPLLLLLLWWLLLCLQEELWTQMLLKSLGFYIWRSCTITEGVVGVYTAWRSILHLDSRSFFNLFDKCSSCFIRPQWSFFVYK
ncbi:protein FAM13A-like [Oncorhynchus kisutch]|uniref:protein FAM13A-like n=1 Tax=Oncorhynchus kisutch TaxID=8019 RepID=UPI0012DFA70D|nr:protein FAM13A-like [Oncorhynchus kisutch]